MTFAYYKEADERLTKLLIDIPDYAENERKTVINNMIWNHMKNGYVILGNKLIHDYYKDKISSKCLFYLCWGYYKQLDYENFNLYFNRLKSLELDNLLIRVVECCKEFFDLGSKEILLDRFVNLLKICDKQKLPNIQELLIGDVIDLANDLKNMDALVYALTLKSTIYTNTE